MRREGNKIVENFDFRKVKLGAIQTKKNKVFSKSGGRTKVGVKYRNKVHLSNRYSLFSMENTISHLNY